MIAKLTQDSNYIELIYQSEAEMLSTSNYFTRKVKNYHFLKKKFKGWDGSVNYLIGMNKLRVTMWSKLLDMCEKQKLRLEWVGMDNYFRNNITYEQVESFCTKLMSIHAHIRPRPYQIDAVYQAFRYRKSCIEVATGGGKTLIMYMYMMLLRKLKVSGNILIISPDPSLVIQSYEEFCDYACGQYELKMGLVYGGSKDKAKLESYDHIIGNFASLVKLDPSFYNRFDTIICDEAHRSVSKSIKDIIEWCGNTVNLLGCSGSYPSGQDADAYTIENNFGPVSKAIKKRDLMDMGSITDITVRMITVKFCDDATLREFAIEKSYIEDPEKVLRYEQNFIRSNKRLLDWKCEFTINLSGNTLVYFLDKKSGYGKRLYEGLQELNFRHNLGKQIYYIDGDTPTDDRELYKNQIRNDDTGNSILVANYGTFSTGQSIKNLVNVVTGESIKSDIMLNQGSGRLTRLSDGKDMSYYYDIVENTNVSLRHPDGTVEHKKCYMYNWSKSRLQYYKDEQLTVEHSSIDISTATHYSGSALF